MTAEWRNVTPVRDMLDRKRHGDRELRIGEVVYALDHAPQPGGESWFAVDPPASPETGPRRWVEEAAEEAQR